MTNEDSRDNRVKTSLSRAVEDAITTSTVDQGVVGTDSEGREYYSIDEMWEAQGWKGAGSRKDEWYEKATDYYESNCPATVNGVLGGFASISVIDLEGSRQFLDRLGNDPDRRQFNWTSGAAAECGAGIGRVTKGLLLPLGVTRCDLVESSARLLAEAPAHIGDPGASRCRYFCLGLQEWNPTPDTYTIVWIQWVLIYLTDEDCVEFLRKCGASLRPGGVICFKENTCAPDSGEAFAIDSEDSSVTRSMEYWLQLFHEAGLRIVAEEIQDNFPDDLYPVPMIALEVNPSS